MTIEELTKDLTDVEILFLTVVGEARGEPVEGQVAVANVIMNRTRKEKKSVKRICLAHKQFSCWNEEDPNRKLLENMIEDMIKGYYDFKQYKQIQWIVDGVYEGKINDNTKGSLNYMTTELFNSDKRPNWAKVPKTDPFSKGNHTFFTA